MSDKDGLTGLNLRAAYDEAFKNAHQSDMAVVYFDVNNLKLTNDTMGHKYGDKLLKECVTAMKENFRENEIYRTGGDEFIVLMDGVGPAIIEKKLKAIADKMLKLTNEDTDGMTYQVAAGYCVGNGELTKQEIEEKAESNMYINKKELKRKYPTKGDPRNNSIFKTEYRKATIPPVEKAKLPDDIDDDIHYIEKVYSSTFKETVLKCAIIVACLASMMIYLILA